MDTGSHQNDIILSLEKEDNNLRAELSASEKLNKELADKCIREHDWLAAAQTKIEAQSKRISWMAGDALKAKDDLAAAKAELSRLEKLIKCREEIWRGDMKACAEARVCLEEARAECARKHEALTQAMHAIRHVTCVAGSEYAGGPRLKAALGPQIYDLLVDCEKPGHAALSTNTSWLSRQIAEARRPLVEAMNLALDLLSVGADEEDNRACAVLKTALKEVGGG